MTKPARKIWTKVEPNKFSGEDSEIMRAVDQLVDFVSPTLGPKIRHILVDFGYKTELMDDGVSIAEEFELDNEFEDAIAAYVREASKKTDQLAGDGTTTTMVILRALLRGVIESGLSYPEVRDALDADLKAINKQLDERAVKVKDKDTLLKVAKTSMDDEEAAKVVSDVVWETGAKGATTITDHTGRGIEVERVEGFVANRGFIARGMITDKEKQCYEAPNKNFTGAVGIAVVENLLSTKEDILPILEAAEERGFKNLCIFCPNLIAEALGVAAVNQMRGVFNLVAVQLPGQGDKAKDFVGDLCTITGAKTPVGDYDASDLGSADGVTSTAEDTTVIGGHGNKKEIKDRIAHLQTKADESKEDYDKDYYHARQARLAGGIVVIKVGGTTETEIRLRLKKVEDAVNACKCALEEGVVPGAGMTLKTLQVGSQELKGALSAVHDTVLHNADMKEQKLDGDKTVNVLTGKSGNFLDVGVVDAVKVLRVAVENAVSIAKILFTTSGVITSKRDEHQES